MFLIQGADARKNKALIKELSIPKPGTEELHFPTVYSQSFYMQCLACLWKQHKSYWRNPYYNVVRFFFTTVSSIMLGSLYWKLGSKTGTFQDLFNIMGGMYAATLFIGISNSSSILPVVGVERTVYYRERAAGMYSALPYALAQAAIEIPYVLLQTTLYTLIVYAMLSFQWTAAKFLWFIFFMFLSFLYFAYYGMMCVAVTPSHHFAAIIASGCYGLWNLFSGFLIPRPAIPIWWRWYYWGTPVAFVVIWAHH
ncbi:hypothetical protein L7F22_049642 [Adiantum nelumboides]|nr:hypothetical protein [Adiantum nelumboides]